MSLYFTLQSKATGKEKEGLWWGYLAKPVIHKQGSICSAFGGCQNALGKNMDATQLHVFSDSVFYFPVLIS